MKKVICATLALMLLTASLAACNNIDDEIENSKPLTSETTTDNINSEANAQISVFATYNSTISIYKKAVENALLFDLQKEADGRGFPCRYHILQEYHREHPQEHRA